MEPLAKGAANQNVHNSALDVGSDSIAPYSHHAWFRMEPVNRIRC
jgi:hypothetical protein